LLSVRCIRPVQRSRAWGPLPVSDVQTSKNLTACFASSSVQMLNRTSALSKIQNVGAGPGSTRLQATFAAMACIQLNLAFHRIKLTSAPKAKFISNPTVASPSVAAHRQRPGYCLCATNIFIASLLQEGDKAYHIPVVFGTQTSESLDSARLPESRVGVDDKNNAIQSMAWKMNIACTKPRNSIEQSP